MGTASQHVPHMAWRVTVVPVGCIAGAWTDLLETGSAEIGPQTTSLRVKLNGQPRHTPAHPGTVVVHLGAARTLVACSSGHESGHASRKRASVHARLGTPRVGTGPAAGRMVAVLATSDPRCASRTGRARCKYIACMPAGQHHARGRHRRGAWALFVRRYGWRAYALPFLIVVTVAVALQTANRKWSARPATALAYQGTDRTSSTSSARSTGSTAASALPGMPALLSQRDVYAADRPRLVSPAIAHDRAYVYVPNTNSHDVSVIDQHTMKVISTFPGGNEPQHIVPSYDLKTLYVTADKPGHGSLTPIDPRTGTPGRRIPIDDVYNMYYTPDGRYAIVVQEQYKRLAFYDPHTWVLHDTLAIPSCNGIDHMDFTADGTKLLASCEFANQMVVIDVATHKLLEQVPLYPASNGMPQDVKLAPDGRVFYVADMMANGVYVIDAATFRITSFQPTGKGAHGLYMSRDSRRMFVSNRDEGSITVINLASGRPEAKWRIPGGGSPDMGNLSADGRVLWLSGRYDNVVYALNAANGHLIAKVAVGAGPHGLCVWPLPGRYSLGHTGILR
jgi:YVTN family beta-propeller protein